MQRSAFAILLAAGAVGLGTMAAAQEKGATGVVAVRQATMEASGKHMAAIKSILTEAPELIGNVAFHASALAEAAEYTPAMFPKGSDQPPTGALAAIWDKPDDFRAAAEKAEDLARKLADTAKGGDAKATLAAFATLGKEGCGGCHQTFRKKES